MEDRLVQDCIQCLRSLSDGQINVNALIRRTGLYKNYVFEAKATLMKAHLIEVSTDPKHNQKQLLKLTELGNEIARLLRAITEFNKSYTDLVRSIKVNFEFDDRNKRVLRNKLLAINWKRDWIADYSGIAEVAHFCKQFSMNLFSEALITRYYLLSARFNLNSEAKQILIKLIADALSEQLLTRQQEPGNVWSQNEIMSQFHPSLFEWIQSGSFYPFAKAEQKTAEIRNVSKSLVGVMAPPKDYVRDNVIAYLKEYEENENLINLYEEYLASAS